MVFDPERMKWLKVDPRSFADPSNTLTPGSVSIEDEDDPFAGIDDLPDDRANIAPGSGGANKENEGPQADEWALGEEFDLGPTFIKRQRNEEVEWRRWAEKWFPGGEKWEGHSGGLGRRDSWKWEIRRVAERYEMERRY
jgi:hypothetical protein